MVNAVSGKSCGECCQWLVLLVVSPVVSAVSG